VCMSTQLPPDAATAIRSYLRFADRILPGGIIACAVTGSIALGGVVAGLRAAVAGACCGEVFRADEAA
ncbi:hypothetical protein R0K30_23050, partial [Bacillus sp. SIMBA_154]|uniref:hypothetical protein n=1 Tax=Bacillus sp. SIMBA_154 TaxID=3080859 RepID=UPI0039781343